MNNGKYSPEITQEICKYLRAGNTQRDSSKLAGISEETYYTWKKTHPEFSEVIEKAELECKARNIAIIQRAGENVIFTEQKYAKQIGLLVDRAKPGTIIKLNVEEFDKFIDKNKLNEAETISFQSNSVVVKLGKGEGYKFNLVSNNPIDKSFYRNNDGNLILSLQVRVE